MSSWGRSGTWKGQFQDPVDLVVEPDGQMHVADSGNFRLQWLTAEGEYVAEWELPEHRGPKFQSPVGLARDSQGYLYVGDIANNRIYKLEALEGGGE